MPKLAYNGPQKHSTGNFHLILFFFLGPNSKQQWLQALNNPISYGSINKSKHFRFKQKIELGPTKKNFSTKRKVIF